MSTEVHKRLIVNLVIDQDGRAYGAYHAAQVRRILWTTDGTNGVLREPWVIAASKCNEPRREVIRLVAL